MPLRLIIEDDEGTTTIVPLGPDAITIGRQQGNTIQLTEKNVSRRHARLYPESDHWIIEDLGSYNGVKVNGQGVEGRVTLREGDVVQIGDYHLALTEDVDKRTLNFDAPSEPANDAGEPLLASSSTDLPRLSAEELAQLQSGPHTAQGSPAMLDSGPMPASAMPPYGAQRSSGSGMLLGFGVVIVLAVGAGLFWMVNQGDGEGGKDTKAAAVAPPSKAGTKAPPPQPEPTKSVAVVEPSDGGAEPDPLANGSAADDQPPPDDGGLVEAVPEPDPVPPEPEPEPEPEAPKPTPKPSNNKPKVNKDRPRPQPEQPPEAPPPPPVDVDALIAEAKKLAFSNPSKAYSLANDAYQAGKSQEAAAIMVSTACKMKDEGKAQRAFKKLKGSKRDDAIKLCKMQGIELE